MYKINNVELRNLEEQVQKNKEDIARHYAIDRAMSNLGIEVIGQVATAELLPDPLTYTGKYGDTFAVGSKPAVDAGNATYDYYVYTRPDPNSGQINNYWLNIGKISIAGPQGPEGPQGPQGPEGKSSKWFYGDDLYTVADEGDFLLTSAGLVYEYNGTQWAYKTNIKGPQGPQGVQGQQGPTGATGPVGPKGERGDVGGFINIRSILPSTDDLPLPSTIDNLTAAYLVGAAEPYDLYIQIGETSDVATWNNVGPLNVATLVTSGGEYQNVWDADTKVNSSNVTYKAVYARYSNEDTTIPVTNATSDTSVNLNGCIPSYVYEENANHLRVNTPNKDVDAANKKYVDDLAATKLNKPTSEQLTTGSGPYVAVFERNGNPTYKVCNPVYIYPHTDNPIPAYKEAGKAFSNSEASLANNKNTIFVATPVLDWEATNKKYVDDNKGTQLYKHLIAFSIQFTKDDGATTESQEFTVSYMSPSSVAITGINNNTWFNEPANSVLVVSESPYNFCKNENALSFQELNTSTYGKQNWEMWKDLQVDWPAGTGVSRSLTFISDTVTKI